MTTSMMATVVRERHPLQGRVLRMLGRMRRHGRLELLLELPDGSKCLIPAVWTDLAGDDAGDGGGRAPLAATLGSLQDMLAACGLVAALTSRRVQDREKAAPQSQSKEDSRAACAAESAARPRSGATPMLLAQIPPSQVAAAITLLASLIAKACLPPDATTKKVQVSADE